MAKTYFKIEYEGNVITLPKSDVQFKGKYGIVNAKYYLEVEDGMLEYPIFGVVDKRFKPIVDLNSGIGLIKADIVADSLILLCKFEGILTVFQMMLPNIHEWYRIPVKDYEVLDDRTLILRGGYANHLGAALYDVPNRNLLTPFYSTMSDFEFKEEFGEEVAEATTFIYDKNENYVAEISFYINKKGKVVSDSRINDTYYPMGTSIEDIIKDYFDSRLSR